MYATNYRPVTSRRERAVANRLATLASDATITYRPRYLRTGTGYPVWYLFTAYRTGTGETWPYLLRRDWGSYAGSFAR